MKLFKKHSVEKEDLIALKGGRDQDVTYTTDITYQIQDGRSNSPDIIDDRDFPDAVQ
jgi:hypothetical protein